MCVGEDAADGKSSRPWAMHGKPPGRPAGPSIEYPSIIFRSSIDDTPRAFFEKSIIGRFSDKEWTLDGVWRSFPIPKGDPWLILHRGKVRLGGFEADRLRDRLFSTQRFRRGRGQDFIYTKNVARPRFGFYLRNEFRAAGVRC